MDNRTALLPAFMASASGVMLFAVMALVTGKREPWDAAAYWLVAYPTAILVCALLGYSYPERPWRWAFCLFEAQFIAMCVRNGELGNLWPLGMALFAIMALPAVAASALASRFNVKQ